MLQSQVAKLIIGAQKFKMDKAVLGYMRLGYFRLGVFRDDYDKTVNKFQNVKPPSFADLKKRFQSVA